ncbi:MAG: AsmA family protein, partial [Ginsengibacter sp.]
MEPKDEVTKKKKPLISVLAKILVWILGSSIFLIILILILIQTSFVQNFARKKVVNYLENKLHTQVEIGKLSVKFPTTLSLQHVFFEDQSKDTLLFGGEMKVDINMLKLIRNEIEIKEISLNNMVVKVKRLPPDSTFNFQFIVDAFNSPKATPKSKSNTSSMQMNVNRILVNKT